VCRVTCEIKAKKTKQEGKSLKKKEKERRSENVAMDI